MTEFEDTLAEAALTPRQQLIIAVTARKFSAADRRKAAKSGAAMKDGSFPIVTAQDVTNAVKLVGHAPDPAKAKAHVIRRAKAIGATNRLPDDWK